MNDKSRELFINCCFYFLLYFLFYFLPDHYFLLCFYAFLNIKIRCNFYLYSDCFICSCDKTNLLVLQWGRRLKYFVIGENWILLVVLFLIFPFHKRYWWFRWNYFFILLRGILVDVPIDRLSVGTGFIFFEIHIEYLFLSVGFDLSNFEYYFPFFILLLFILYFYFRWVFV